MNFSRSGQFHMKSRVCLKYFVNYCLWKQLFASKSSQIISKLTCLTIFVTLRIFTQFYSKIRATIYKKALKFVLLDNYFSDLFTEVQILY